MNKSILLITIAVVIMGIVFSILSFINFEPTQPYIGNSAQVMSNQSQNQGQVNNTPANISVNPPTQVGITLAELAMHNQEADCWVGYKGKVYDLTTWLPKHPGSARTIVRYCGTSTEFQEAFARKHGESKASLFMKVSIYKGDLI